MIRATTRSELRKLIQANWSVLDVGSGDNPFELATVLLDHGPRNQSVAGQEFSENPKLAVDRGERPFVRGTLEALPFASGSFDFVYAAHVLEHTCDPTEAIEELMRVAPRGYIETPRAWFEFVDGSPFHKWLIDFAGGELLLRPKTEEETQFSLSRRIWDQNRPLYLELYGESLTGPATLDPGGASLTKSVCHLCLHWEGDIPFKILTPSQYIDAPRNTCEERIVKGALPVSVIVHTRNESKNIKECLDSCLGWAGEVIVADMDSIDATRHIARTCGAKVIPVKREEEFDRARNISAKFAEFPWILFLDADERLTETVRMTVEQLISSAPDEVSAFQLPFKVVSFGAWIQHAGSWWPSYKSPPLLRAGKFRFPGPVHLPAIIDGQVVRISPRSEEDAILHFSHLSVEAYMGKMNSYTTLEAIKKQRGHQPATWEEAADRFGEVMRWYYDDTNGREDGLPGFLLSLGSGIYEAVAGMKHLESTGSQSIPSSAQEFFERALKASKVRKKDARNELPAWVPHLVSWLAGEPGSKPFDPSDLADQVLASGPGWVVLDESILERRSESRLATAVPKGWFVLFRGSATRNAKARERIERAFQTDCHLFDTEEQVWWFLWNDGLPRAPSRICSIAHRNALNVMGGGEVQLFQTIRALRSHGVMSDIGIGKIPEGKYGLFHVYSLHHRNLLIGRQVAGKPYVLTPIYWDRSELAWVAPRIMGLFSSSGSSSEIEAGYAALRSQRDASLEARAGSAGFDEEVEHLILNAAAVLPNASSEFDCLRQAVPELSQEPTIVPNAVDGELPVTNRNLQPELKLPERFVLCVGRLEPNKNQLTMLYALRDLGLPVVLIGSEVDLKYAALCREVAGPDAVLLGSQTAGVVSLAMAKATVHCLPSFGETPGLANLEAAAIGCPLVVSNRGAEREYFGEMAEYCDPLDPASIRRAVLAARKHKRSARTARLQKKVRVEYCWQNVASQLLGVYNRILAERHISG